MERNAFIIRSDGLLEKYTGDEKHVVIPEGVKKIGYEAFADSEIESVELSDYVEEIGIAAFLRCRSLREVDLKYCQRIGIGAFAYCSSLKEITFNDSIFSVGHSAFLECSGLETVNYNIRVTGEWGVPAEYFTYSDYGNFMQDVYPVFYGCTSLKTVNFRERIDKIPDYAFYECCVENINMNNYGSYDFRIGKAAFAKCGRLKEIIIDCGFGKIEDEAFADCVNLEKAVLYSWQSKREKDIKESASTVSDEIYKDEWFEVQDETEWIDVEDDQLCELDGSFYKTSPISDSAFRGSDKVVIYGAPYSSEEEYAKRNGIAFKNA